MIPQVNGYNVYKADLHTHTVFSDGQVMPNFRVNEASLDHKYMDNGSTIDALIEDLRALNGKADTTMDSLLIVASESPEGPV